MAEKKLRMAVPDRKWLVHPERWNVTDILRRAGIGEYTIGEPNTTFSVSSSFPDIEVEVVKPRRIPSEIASGNYDIGITGHDWWRNEYAGSLSELVDLGCGYTDLAFMTNLLRWKEVEGRKKEVEKMLKSPNPSDLDLFLAYYGKAGKEVVCRSEYQNIANASLRSRQESFPEDSRFKYFSEKSSGNTEACLFCRGNDMANVILEIYATGDHAKEKDLVVLEIIGNSTARLYAGPSTQGRDEESVYKCAQVKRIRGRIMGVVKSIEELVQVRFVFKLYPKEKFLEDFDAFLFCDSSSGGKRKQKIIHGSNDHITNPIITLDRIVAFNDLPAYSGIEDYDFRRFFSNIQYPYEVVHGSKAAAGLIQRFEITEDKIKRVASTLEKNALEDPNEMYREAIPPLTAPPEETFRKFMSWFDANLQEITFYRLKFLYGYCPIFRSNETGDEKDKYPCCDVSKLRPEHEEEAIIYKHIPG